MFTRENFEKAGITDLSKIIINAHQYLDSNYSGTGSSCLTDLSTTGPNGFNLEAFANYLKEQQMTAIVTEFGAGTDSASCREALTQFMNYLEANAVQAVEQHGFVGGTVWSTGHGWGGYNLRVEPDSYHWDVISSYLNPSQTEDQTSKQLGDVIANRSEKKTEPAVKHAYLPHGFFDASTTRKSINMPSDPDLIRGIRVGK